MESIGVDRIDRVEANRTVATVETVSVRGMICFDHFQEADFKRKDKSALKPDSIPSVFRVEDERNEKTEKTCKYFKGTYENIHMFR